jgi:hypothetical protein
VVNWEIGRLGNWEVGKWEIGKLGDWEVGEWEIGEWGPGGGEGRGVGVGDWGNYLTKLPGWGSEQRQEPRLRAAKQDQAVTK